jgi:hypothetical protein
MIFLFFFFLSFSLLCRKNALLQKINEDHAYIDSLNLMLNDVVIEYGHLGNLLFPSFFFFSHQFCSFKNSGMNLRIVHEY